MSFKLTPLGDRLLVRLTRVTEKKIGDQIITIAHSDKKRIQPETAKYLVIATGPDVTPDVCPGDFVVARSDCGAVLSPDLISGDEYRLYRLIEYPEILSKLVETKEVTQAADVLPEKVVINGN